MEQLNEAQQTAVRKSSSDRLRALLMKVGLAEEFVMGMTRDDLMQKYAEPVSYTHLTLPTILRV